MFILRYWLIKIHLWSVLTLDYTFDPCKTMINIIWSLLLAMNFTFLDINIPIYINIIFGICLINISLSFCLQCFCEILFLVYISLAKAYCWILFLYILSSIHTFVITFHLDFYAFLTICFSLFSSQAFLLYSSMLSKFSQHFYFPE